jgi:hypothetical protein
MRINQIVATSWLFHSIATTIIVPLRQTRGALVGLSINYCTFLREMRAISKIVAKTLQHPLAAGQDVVSGHFAL